MVGLSSRQAPVDFVLQGVCVKGDWWGVHLLAESTPTLGDAQCSAKPATCSVLTYLHADISPPEACFLHGRIPLGADPNSNIKDMGLVDDL